MVSSLRKCLLSKVLQPFKVFTVHSVSRPGGKLLRCNFRLSVPFDAHIDVIGSIFCGCGGSRSSGHDLFEMFKNPLVKILPPLNSDLLTPFLWLNPPQTAETQCSSLGNCFAKPVAELLAGKAARK